MKSFTGNTKVLSLVEAQTLRFGGGLEGQDTMRESRKSHRVTVWPPGGSGVFLPSHNKIHQTQRRIKDLEQIKTFGNVC